MEEVSSVLKVVVYSKDILKMIKNQEMENLSLSIEKYMLDRLKGIFDQVKVS
jgi:hypothetical protein